MRKRILIFGCSLLFLAGSVFTLYKIAIPDTSYTVTSVNADASKQIVENNEEITYEASVSTQSELTFSNHNRKSGELENLMFKIAEKTNPNE